MSPVVEVSHIFQRELRKNFRSAKGIALAVLTLLGGSGIALLIAKYNEFKRQEMGDIPAEQLHMLREKALEKMYEPDTAKWLADTPEVLLGLLYFTVWLTPLLVALMGFDSIASDIQHRTVRYWTLRTRRSSYFVGKWAGLWATVSTVTLAMYVMVMIVSVVRGDSAVEAIATSSSMKTRFFLTLGWNVRFWLISLPLSAIWCAIAVFVSSLFRTPIVALLVTLAAFFTLWVVYLIAAVAHIEPLLYVYPNHYDHLMLDPKAYRFGTGILASMAMAGAYVAGGSALFARRDV
ncbi:MAG TPA: ABC transporter permease subunit [Labilithrix sp.]|nr:ABC transporter permease subunit [Labilithrix sp.]